MRPSFTATVNRPPSEGVPRYSVRELNESIGALLDRGFAPRFLVEATVSRPQRKKGHLWLTLTDGEASISAVAWASTLERLSFVPEEGDGVVVCARCPGPKPPNAQRVRTLHRPRPHGPPALPALRPAGPRFPAQTNSELA